MNYDMKPGEKLFVGVLLLIGLFFLYHSVELWGRVNPPRESSAAILPLMMTVIWVALTGAIFVKNLRGKTPLSDIADWKAKVWAGLCYVFPRDLVVIIGAVVLYCGLLLAGISFYVVTSLFLYGTMCYLMKSGFLKNVIWTAIFMVFTVVVFGMLFNVVFP
ncbi:MAG: hypothetical protein FWD98_04555 [Defluviitaleaceae bacterium]|nr:hypothetical protein [Defluviitaleaceae bacterium]